VSVQSDVQKALFAELQAALSIPVYDAVPDGATLPYVVYASSATEPDDGLTDLRRMVSVTLNVYSQSKGQREVNDVMGVIDNTLHNAKPPLDQGYVINMRITSANAQRDPEEGTYIGRVTILVKVDL